MLKRFLIFGGFLLLASLAIIPYWTGVEAERQFKQFLQTVPPYTFALQETNYQRGWLHSSARTVYQVQNLATFSTQQLVLVHRIQHALPPYFDTVIQSTVMPDPKATTEAAPAQTTQFHTDFAPMSVNTTVALNGDMRSQIAMPTVALHRPADQTAVQWHNFSGEIHLSQHAQQIENQIQLPQLQYGSTAGELQLQDLFLNANLTQGLLGFLTGQGRLTIGQIHLKSALINATQLNQFQLQWHNEIENELLNIVISLDLNHILIDQQRYGPGHLQLTLRNLYAPALNELQLALDSASNATGNAQHWLMISALMQHLPQLLAKQPYIHLQDFYFDTPSGRSQGHLLVNVTPTESINLFNPNALIQLLNANMQLQLPENALHNLIAVLLEQPLTQAPASPLVTQQVQTLVNQGWLTTQPDNALYHSHITLEHGVLTVNGRQQPLGL